MVNRESLKEKLRSKLNFCKQSRKSVESKINNVEKQDKKKDSSIYDNETSKNRKKRRKERRNEVRRYSSGGNQELNLTPEQQQEFFANMMKQREEAKTNPEPESISNDNISLSDLEEQQLKELNELIDLKDNLTNKNGDLLINHEKSDRIVEIINNIKETDTYKKYATENIDIVNDVSNSQENNSIDVINDVETVPSHNENHTIDIIDDIPTTTDVPVINETVSNIPIDITNDVSSNNISSDIDKTDSNIDKTDSDIDKTDSDTDKKYSKPE